MLLISFSILVSCVSLLVALITLLKNSASSLHRWLFAFIMSGSAWVIFGNLQGIFHDGNGVLLARLTFVSASSLAFAMLGFSRSVVRAKTPRSRSLVDLSFFIITLFLSLTDLVVAGSFGDKIMLGGQELQRGPAYPLVIIAILYFIVTSIVLLIKETRKSYGRKRSQISLILWGLSLGSLVGITTNVILPNVVHNTFPSRFAFIGITIWTAPLVYAIVRHKFLDIRLTIVRALGYLLALITTLLGYSLVLVLLSQLLLRNALGFESISHTYIYGTAVAIFTAFTFQPLHRFFNHLTRDVFYRDAYDTKDVLDKISSTLVSVVGVKKVALQASNIMAEALKSDVVSVVIIDDLPQDKLRIISAGKQADGVAKLVNLLEHHPPVITVIDDIENPSNELYVALQKANLSITARLKTNKEHVGYLLFGYKVSGNMYTSQDVELIKIVADELAVALQNSLRFDEITHFNETLQKEVTDATEELREKNHKLEELDKAKNEFISMASHQLRTPLTSLRGYVSMALEGDEGDLNPQQKRILREADDSSRRLAYLINDFLNVSRLTANKFTIEPSIMQLSKIIEEELGYLQSGAKIRNLKLVSHIPHPFPLLRIDEDKIRQVIVNFVDNAIFYSLPGGTITIDLIKTAHDVQFTVKDHGIGVPASERHKLFNKFYRATNARAKRPDGTGIGLYVAKKVILAHGGHLIFESQEGKGSTFGFSLPIKLIKLSDSQEVGTRI